MSKKIHMAYRFPLGIIVIILILGTYVTFFQSPDNNINTRISFSEYLFIESELKEGAFLDITAGDENLTAIISPNISVELDEEIDLEINMDKVHLFKQSDGKAIF